MNEEITEIELEDEIDLHQFHPKDAKAILKEFIEIEFDKNKKEIRIAHGKGRSVLKNMVINELKNNEKILSYRNDGANWGATIAALKRKQTGPDGK